MSPKVNEQYIIFLRQITSLFFYVLYTLINTLIVIGEITTLILLLPFRLTAWGFEKVYLRLLAFARRIKSRFIPKLPLLLPSKVGNIDFKEIEQEEKEQVYSIILHPTASSRKLLTINILQVFPYVRRQLFSGLQMTEQIVVSVSLIIFQVLKNLVLAISQPFIRVVKSYKDIIFYISGAILVTQILFDAAKRFIARTIRFFYQVILLPFKLVYLSVTSSFRFFYIGFLVCLIGIIGFQSYLFISHLPSPYKIGKTNYPISSHIFDRNGRLLYEVYRDQNRTPIKLNELPPYVHQASIAIEDKDFYHHNGISIFGGMLRALKDTYKTNELQGGSTITQQLIKTALLTPERTVERKIKEVILAVWAERIYTKNQIMEMYLNQIPYGGSAYGIQEAARTYFGKDARQLTVSEAALLAGLTRAPSIYSPFVNPDIAIRRRNEVLSKMYELNFITDKQRQLAHATKIAIREPKTSIRAPHFVFYTKSHLESEYGIKEVEEGGLRVITTLDLEIQNEAEKILREELDKIRYLNVTNGGIVVSDPNSGEILAMVGSRDYFATPNGAFNVSTALRQPGSSLKPLLYSLALERGYTAATIIDDSPISFTISDTEVYRPVNYDGAFHGRTTLRSALANSYNIPAVKVINAFGVTNYVDHARKMGIDTWNDTNRFGLSLSLGGGEVTMIDVTEAFGVFANKGNRVDLTPISKLTNSEREILAENNPLKEKALDEGVAFIMSDILSDNVARQAAFGRGSALEIPGYKVAVKTGTTDSKKDNWTVGYTPEFVVTVWVGNNDNTPMNQQLASGITGAAPVWNRVMTYLLKNKSSLGTKVAFDKPDVVVQRKCYGRDEYFMLGTDNNVFCQPSVLKQQARDREIGERRLRINQ